MNELWSAVRLGGLLTCAALVLTPRSNAAAEERKVCESGDPDPQIGGPVLWCTVTDAGNVAQANLVDPQRVNLLIRDLQGFRCEVKGYDELGTWVGTVGTDANSGHLAVTDCFRNRDWDCYDRGAIAQLLLSCYVDPENTGGFGGL